FVTITAPFSMNVVPVYELLPLRVTVAMPCLVKPESPVMLLLMVVGELAMRMPSTPLGSASVPPVIPAFPLAAAVVIIMPLLRVRVDPIVTPAPGAVIRRELMVALEGAWAVVMETFALSLVMLGA